MLANLSKLLTVQLSPLFVLASVFLILFSYLGPVPIFEQSIALTSISTFTPSSTRNNVRSVHVRREVPRSAEEWGMLAMEAVDPDNCNSLHCKRRRAPRQAAYLRLKRDQEQQVKGPAVRFGLLGSCYKNGDRDSICTIARLEPVYDVTLLPQNTPEFTTSPPSTSPHFMLISLLLLIFYLALTALPSVPYMPAAVSSILSKPMVTQLTAWIGILGFLSGFATTLALRIVFGRDVDSFNNDADKAGVSLVANIENGFTMLWIAYALIVPSLICSLFKIHMDSKAAGK